MADTRPRLILMQGIPGCGKSSAMKNYRWDCNLICRDDIRKAMDCYGDKWDEKREKDVHFVAAKQLEALMIRGLSVVLDETHTSIKNVMRELKLADKYEYKTILHRVYAPLELCIERRSKSPDYVPEEVMIKLEDALVQNFPMYSLKKDWGSKFDEIVFTLGM